MSFDFLFTYIKYNKKIIIIIGQHPKSLNFRFLGHLISEKVPL